MKKHEENKQTMYDAVLSLLTANGDKTGTLPVFAESFTKFKAAREAIKTRAIAMNSATEGKTATKRAAEDDLVDAIIRVSSALFSLGRKNNDLELQSRAKIERSTLQRMRDTELVVKGTEVYQLAEKFRAELEPYTITNEEVDTFKTKVNAFETSLGTREAGMAMRGGARQSLTEDFVSTDDILEMELDKHMELLKKDFPQFYDEYLAARVIKDMGIRHNDEEPPPEPPAPPTA
jgi:hypothetical protein